MKKATPRLILPAALVALVLLQQPGLACTPYIQLVMLFTPATFWGGYALKSLAGLAGVVALKCLVFAWKSEFRGATGALAMILGNLVSSAVGVLLVLTVVPPAGPLLSLLLLPVFAVVGRRLVRQGHGARLGATGQAGLLFLCYAGALAAFFAANSLQSTSYLGYWLLKLLYATLGAGIGFLVSVTFEERVIAWIFARTRGGERSFLDPVFYANACAFVLTIGVVAAGTLPERLRSPGYLIGPPGSSDASITGTVRNVALLQTALDRYAREHSGLYPDSLDPAVFPWPAYVNDRVFNAWMPDRSGPQIVEGSFHVDTRGSRDRLVRAAEADRRLFRWPGTVRYYVDKQTHRFFALTGSHADGVPLRVPGSDGNYRDNWVLHN